MKIKKCKQVHPGYPHSKCYLPRGHPFQHRSMMKVGYNQEVDQYGTEMYWTMEDPAICTESITVAVQDDLGLPINTDFSCHHPYNHTGMHESDEGFIWLTPFEEQEFS